MKSTENAIERNFKSTFDNMEQKLASGVVSNEDLAEFAQLSVRAKLGTWAATTEAGLKHKLADMALQAVK